MSHLQITTLGCWKVTGVDKSTEAGALYGYNGFLDKATGLKVQRLLLSAGSSEMSTSCRVANELFVEGSNGGRLERGTRGSWLHPICFERKANHRKDRFIWSCRDL